MFSRIIRFATAQRKHLSAFAVLVAAFVLGGFSPAAATATPPNPRATVHHDLLLPHKPTTMGDFMSMVLHNVAAFWTTKLVPDGYPAPRVHHDWFLKRRVRTRGCGSATREDPFYCPGDDTIYISQQFARKVWSSREHGSGGTTAGDFGVAAVIAHEYAHNIQTELGVYRAHPRARQVAPFELEADCMSGLWANSAYYEGILQAGDPEEAMATVAAFGDYNTSSADHHGTPAERKAAWLLGYTTGSLAACGQYVANA